MEHKIPLDYSTSVFMDGEVVYTHSDGVIHSLRYLRFP